MMNVRLVRKSSGDKKYIKNLKEKTNLQVGWFENSRYDDATPVAAVAAQNEYGAHDKNIPPRPFMRPTVTEHEKEWVNTFSKLIKKGTLSNSFEKLGLVVSGQIRAKIASIWEPPLKAATVQSRLRRYRQRLDEASEGRKRGKYGKLKGGVSDSITKPLIDTGVMISSVSYKVSGGVKE